jgi:uncharacterized delta-60 repeat protein
MKDISIAFFMSWSCCLAGQPGTLDPSFGTGGIVISAFNTGFAFDEAHAIAVLQDQRILVAGATKGSSTSNWEDVLLARYLPDGMLDDSFGNNGWLATPVGTDGDHGRAMVVQPDGKILVAGFGSFNGERDFIVMRYSADGALDPSFGNMGKVITDLLGGNDEAHAIALQPDGKILVAGQAFELQGTRLALVRYTVNGTLDATFGVGGKATTMVNGSYTYARSLAVQPDGRIVVVGYCGTPADLDICLVRYMANGTLDLSFGQGGKVRTAIGTENEKAYDIALRPDGRMIVCGSTRVEWTNKLVLVQYLVDGTLDNEFGNSGVSITSIPGESVGSAMVLSADGKTLVAGTAWPTSPSFLLARFNSDGSEDVDFGMAASVITPVGAHSAYGNAMTAQADGRVIVAGRTSEQFFDQAAVALVRYESGFMSIPEYSSGVHDLYCKPNPAIDMVQIGFRVAMPSWLRCSLYETSGRPINGFVREQFYGSGDHTMQFDLSTIASGCYVVTLSDHQHQGTLLLIKP